MNAIPGPSAGLTPPGRLGYHGAVSDFKRRLIEATLHQMCGNRTHTARALGLQRTYLLRLMRRDGVSFIGAGLAIRETLNEMTGNTRKGD